MPAVKEPVNLIRDGNKGPDETTLLPRHGLTHRQYVRSNEERQPNTADTRDWWTYHYPYRGHQGNNIPKKKCGLLP